MSAATASRIDPHGVPLIRAGGLAPAIAFVRALGAPMERLLEHAHLPPDTGEDQEALVPLRAAHRFVEAAARREGIPDLGVRVGLQADFDQLGVFGQRVARALTVHEAIETASALFPHYSSGDRLWTARRWGEAHLHHAWDRRALEEPGQLGGMAAALQMNLLRRATGARWQPTHIVLQAPPDPIYRRAGLFGDVPIDFSPSLASITVPEAVLSLPLAPRRPASAAAEWRTPGPAGEFLESMRQVVASLLPNGYPDLHLIAEIVGTSIRTMQRRLAARHTSYARVVEEARFDLARRLLADPGQKVVDVAIEVGYADAAHFTRAFRRWTGTTPRAFRRDHS